jgi:hypothetical protein
MLVLKASYQNLGVNVQRQVAFNRVLSNNLPVKTGAS